MKAGQHLEAPSVLTASKLIAQLTQESWPEQVGGGVSTLEHGAGGVMIGAMAILPGRR